MDKTLLKDFWCYDVTMKWITLKKPYTESYVDISDFLEKQDYPMSPNFCSGDELNFISIYNHPAQEEYLFHLVVDDMCKVLYANSLPAMLELLLQLTNVLNSYFRTCLIVEDLKGDGEICSE